MEARGSRALALLTVMLLAALLLVDVLEPGEPAEELDAETGAAEGPLPPSSSAPTAARLESPAASQDADARRRPAGGGAREAPRVAPGAQPRRLPVAWVEDELAPWQSEGVTRKLLSDGRRVGQRTSRVVVHQGAVYAKLCSTTYCKRRGPSRVLYWLWGLLELVERERVPDVSLLLSTMDEPMVPKSRYGNASSAPPPMLSFGGADDHWDITWPMWVFWGEDSTHTGAGAGHGGFADPAWEETFPQVRSAARERPWEARKSKAFWRGAATGAGGRRALCSCADTELIDAVCVNHKTGEGAGQGVSAVGRTDHKYLVYMDGGAASSSIIPILAAGALPLVQRSAWRMFFSRAFAHTGAFLPVDGAPDKVCSSVAEQVRWAEANPEHARALAEEASRWAEEALSMDAVRAYQLALLRRYAELQRFTVHAPSKASRYDAVTWEWLQKRVRRRRRRRASELVD